MQSDCPKLEQIRKTVNNTSIGQNAAVQTNAMRGRNPKPELAAMRDPGNEIVRSLSEKDVLKSSNSYGKGNRSISSKGLGLRNSSSIATKQKRRTKENVDNANACYENRNTKEGHAHADITNRTKSAPMHDRKVASLGHAKSIEASSPPLRRQHSATDLERKKMLEGVTDDELSYITRVNTKKNAHRNLKSRFTRAKLAMESISSVQPMDALPLVSPSKEAGSGGFQKRESSLYSPKLQAVANEEPFHCAGSSDSCLDFEPATAEFTDLSVDSSTISGRTPTPSVRISTVRTVVSISDLARAGKASVAEEDKEHPSRTTAKTLIPRSMQNPPAKIDPLKVAQLRKSPRGLSPNSSPKHA